MKLNHTPILSSRFDFNTTIKTFSTEASSLRGTPFQSQLYDDACDVGFIMKSTKTGNEVTYVLEKEHKDFEGEVIKWTFVPTIESYNKHREAVNTRVVIFNDWQYLIC